MNELIGQSLHRYRLDALLAEGGMGAIFRAYDVTLLRDVALKIMHPHIARMPDFQERFLLEARSAARLNHPNIVRVYDFGEALSHLYIVMEFIAGQNLRRILQDLRAAGKWIVLPESLQLVREVSLGLHCAHQAGVLHRDIKPENIMLKAEPGESLPYRPVITDLGLAKLAGGAGITQVGTSLGTPAYMSPEQTVGEKTDARSDVYALGILLYELAVGQLPFPIRNLSDAIRYHTRERPPSPRSLRPDLPEGLEPILLRALEKHPQRRFASAEALAQALAQILREMAGTGPGPSVLAGHIPTPQQTGGPEEPGPTQLADGPGTPPGRARDRLTITTHDRKTRQVTLTATGMTIGRSSDNDLVLNHPTVSRRHARIEFDGNDYRVVDLRSTNGTFVGDIKLLPAVPTLWTQEQTLRIGENWLRLERTRLPSGDVGDTQELGRPPETRLGEAAPSQEPLAEQVGLFLDPSELSVEAGSETTTLLTVLNESSVVDHYDLAVSGIPADWVKLAAATVRLLPGEQQDVRIGIQPPRSPQSRAGVHPITVRVTSRDTPNITGQVSASLAVAAFYDLRAELQPRMQSGLTSASFQLRLANAGNADLRVRLEATDAQARCEFRFAPATLVLPATQDRVVHLQVSSTIPMSGDQKRTHTFIVNARAEEAPDLVLQVQGEWAQELPQLELAIHPQKLSSAGEARFSLRISNASATELPVQLSASDPEQGCLYVFSPPEAIVPAGQVLMTQLVVRARAPLASDRPRIFPFTVSASPSGIPALTRLASAEYEQLAPGFDLYVRPERLGSVTDATFSVQITNASNVDLPVELAAHDPEEGCRYIFSPPQALVPPGQQRTVHMLVHPLSPLKRDTPRSFAITVRAGPVGAPVLARQATAEYVQLVPSFDLALQPAMKSRTGGGSFQVHIRNTSESQLTMQLEAADAEQLCDCVFDRNSVPVPPGQIATVELQVRPRARLRGDEPRTHTIFVSARPAEAPALSRRETATWEQLPGRRIALGFILPLVLTLIGWLLAYLLAVMVATIPIGSFGIYEADFATPWGIFGLVAGAVGGLLLGISLFLAERGFGIGRVLAVTVGWTLWWAAAHSALPFVLEYLGLGEPFIEGAPGLQDPLVWAAFGAIAGLLGGLLTGWAAKRAQPAARVWLVALSWTVAFGAGEAIMASVDNLWPLIDWVGGLGFTDNPVLLSMFGLVGLIAGTIGGTLTFWHLFRARRRS